MALRISKRQPVIGTKLDTAFGAKPANVRTRVRLNFIEAQRQILEKSRQSKAARGLIVAMLLSVFIWAIVAKFVL